MLAADQIRSAKAVELDLLVGAIGAEGFEDALLRLGYDYRLAASEVKDAGRTNFDIGGFANGDGRSGESRIAQ